MNRRGFLWRAVAALSGVQLGVKSDTINEVTPAPDLLISDDLYAMSDKVTILHNCNCGGIVNFDDKVTMAHSAYRQGK